MAYTKPMIAQSGVVPYRWRDGQLEVLLITSRRTGRWIVPKGMIEDDLGPASSAEQEAFEEAGVLGVLGDRVIGSYEYEKRQKHYVVEMYVMLVQHELPDWPERTERERAWFSWEEATTHIENMELRALLAQLPQLISSPH